MRRDARHHVDDRHRLEPARDPQAGVVERGIAPDQERNASFRPKLTRNRARPGCGNGVMPIVHSRTIVLVSGVAHRHIELGNTRSVVGENSLANGPAQLGEIGFRRALARN